MFTKILDKAAGWLPLLLEFHRGDENVSWHWVESMDELSGLLEKGPQAEPNEKSYAATIYPFTPACQGMLDDALVKKALKWAREALAEGDIPFVVETESQWGYSAETPRDFEETLDLFRGRPVVIGPEPDLTGDNAYTVRLPRTDGSVS